MLWTGAVSFLPPIPNQSLCSVGVVTIFLRQGARLGPATWARAEDKPQIQLVLLNKMLEDGNTLYCPEVQIRTSQGRTLVLQD